MEKLGTHLDECRPSPLHLGGKEAVPPDCTPAISRQPLLRSSHKKHRRRKEYGYKQETQVHKPPSGVHRLQYVFADKHYYSPYYPLVFRFCRR